MSVMTYNYGIFKIYMLQNRNKRTHFLKNNSILTHNYLMLKKVQNVNRLTESLDKTLPLTSIFKLSSTVLVVY